MKKSPSPIGTSSTAQAADPKELLAAANRASEKVAALHIVFLAICAYILVIVFGTTDLDLLIGKSVKLPVVNVDVPITGFYALAPYLLVLVHFNLLLSLQLLSRKLYAFDDAAQKSKDMTGIYDQLSIFPYNHYLIGRPSRLVGNVLALVVTITMLLLPLVALLTLQARFLAYQSEAVTWMQRLAVWLDVGLVAIFWPVTMSRSESWGAYMGAVWQHAREHWLRWLWWAGGLLITLALLAREVIWSAPSYPPEAVPRIKEYLTWLTAPWQFKLLIAWLLLSLLARPLRFSVRRLSGGRYFSFPKAATAFVLGAPALLAILLLGFTLPLMLVSSGETLDRPAAFSTRLLAPVRYLNLRETVLVGRPLAAATITDLWSGDPVKVKAALKSVQPVNLHNRGLRGADFSNAFLPKADLRGAQLQGAHFVNALLQGAYFTKAQLQEATFIGGEYLAQLAGIRVESLELQDVNFHGAFMQGAIFAGALLNRVDFSEADLRGAVFVEVSLESANLKDAKMQGTAFNEVTLQGANLSGAQLQGAWLKAAALREANLTGAQLQGALLPGNYLEGTNFSRANLQAADVSGADLRGVNLEGAQLQGADLSGAQLLGTNLEGAQLRGASMRNAALYTDSSPKVEDSELIDARGLKWGPLSAQQDRQLREVQAKSKWLSKEKQSRYFAEIEKAAQLGAKPLRFRSCLRDSETQVTCDNELSLAQVDAARREKSEALEKIHETLENLACEFASTARAYIYYFAVMGIASRLQGKVNLADIKSCPGLAQLSRRDKAILAKLVSAEAAQRDDSKKGDPPAANDPRR